MSFELFVLQNSHIDIGYTERQEKIARYHARFIDQAVRCANSPRQRERKPEHALKFTCEGFWAVEQYLKQYGEEGRRAFAAAAKAGWLELSAFYLHMTELLDEGHLRDSLRPAADFAKQNGLKLNVGMASDINGFSWGACDALIDAGVQYLITNLNSHHGGAPFGRPLVPFRWESPKGNSLLVWSGLAYHKANLLGLIPGFNPASDPGIPGMAVDDTGFVDVQDLSLAENRLFAMVDALKSGGYAFDFLPILGSGVYTDNSPVGDSYCELIASWNEKYGEKVHIRTATMEEFFRYLERNAGEIPTYRGDWNDWWTDGVQSTPNEVRLFRNAQRTKRLAERLDPDRKAVSAERLDDIANKLMIYAEHTWGHSSCFYSPWKLLVQQVHARKSALAAEADALASDALDDALEALGEGEFTCRRPFEYRVINPSPVARRCVALLPLDFWEVYHFGFGCAVRDGQGREYACQPTNTLRGRQVAVALELGAGEARDLTLVPVERDNTSDAPGLGNGTFENSYYKINWNENGIHSIIAKPDGQELLDGSFMAPGAPVYQVFPGGNRRDAAGFGYSARSKPANAIHYGRLTSIEVTESGPVFTALRAQYDVPGASVYAVNYTLYAGLPEIHMAVEMTKDLVMDPEGMYAAFPFAVPGGRWYLDKPGAFMLPGRDQLPGTCCDYYAVQHGAALCGGGMGIAVTLLDAPLVTIGGIKLWDFTTSIDPVGPLFSWLTNNKWETNFKSECAGCYEFRYVVSLSGELTEPAKARETLEESSYDAVVVRK